VPRDPADNRVVRVFVLAAALTLTIPAFAGAQTVKNVGPVQVITGDDPTPAPRLASKPRTAQHPRPSPPQKSSASPLADAIVRKALAYVGTPYTWGGTSPRTGFDCSGYVWYVYASAGIGIPRTADAQFAAGEAIEGDPEPGDLVFFQTYDWGASHVGIYLGNGWFVQEIKPNVHLSNFNSPYFRSRYIGARRFIAT
jgi:cell wall-associated NlpC family hydrolase